MSYSARPDRRGLYGKNPVANVRMAMGIKMLAEIRRSVDFKVLVLVPVPSRRRAISNDLRFNLGGSGSFAIASHPCQEREKNE